VATLTVQDILAAGTGATYQAATGGGDAMPTGPNNFLHVKNGGGASITVTIAATGACSQGVLHPISVVVPNAGERMIGPIPARYKDAVTGLAQISYTAVTSVTVGAFQMTPAS
jgi:hypothetical protein